MQTNGTKNCRALLRAVPFSSSRPEKALIPRHTLHRGPCHQSSSRSDTEQRTSELPDKWRRNNSSCYVWAQQDTKTRDDTERSCTTPKKSQTQPASNANLCLRRGNPSTVSKRAAIAARSTYAPLHAVTTVKTAVTLQQHYVGTLGYTNAGTIRQCASVLCTVIQPFLYLLLTLFQREQGTDSTPTCSSPLKARQVFPQHNHVRHGAALTRSRYWGRSSATS